MPSDLPDRTRDEDTTDPRRRTRGGRRGGDLRMTDLQERTLIELRMAEEGRPNRYHPAGWYPVEWVMPRRSAQALMRLEELGLIETHAGLDTDAEETPDVKIRDAWRLRGTGARTTQAGRELLDSMGD